MEGDGEPSPQLDDVSVPKKEDQPEEKKSDDTKPAGEEVNDQNASINETEIVQKDENEKTEAAEVSITPPKMDDAITLEEKSVPATEEKAQLSEVSETASVDNTLEAEDIGTASGGHDLSSNEAIALGQKSVPATEVKAQSSEVSETASVDNTLEAEDIGTASGGHDLSSDEAIALHLAGAEISGLEPDMTAVYLDWKEKEEQIAVNKKMADEHKKEGTRLLNTGKGLEAVAEYTMAISLDPMSHVLHANRSLAHSKNGDHQASLFDAEEAIKLRPKWTKGYVRKGIALKSLGRSNEAIETLEEGLKIDPEDEELKTALRDCETEIENRSSSPPINMENLTSFTGVGKEELDLPTLMAIQESLKEFVGEPSISTGNEPKIGNFPNILIDEPKHMDEPKTSHSDFMISDPKGNKNEWERYMSAPKMNLSKSRPKNTDSGLKSSYAEPKKLSSARKSQQSEPRSGYAKKKTRRHKFMSSSDSESEDDLKSKNEPAEAKSNTPKRKSKFSKSSDSDSDWRPKSKQSAATKVKQVDREVADPKPKIREAEQKENSKMKRETRSKPKRIDSDQSEEESEGTSKLNINIADFTISDPKQEFSEPKPKTSDDKPKRERFKPKSTDSEPRSSTSKINQPKPGGNEAKQKVSNRSSDVGAEEPEKSSPILKTRRSKSKRSDSDDDGAEQKRFSKSKMSDKERGNDDVQKKTSGLEQKSSEAALASVTPEELNKFMKAMKDFKESKEGDAELQTNKSVPKRKDDKPKIEERETEIIDPEQKLSSEPLVIEMDVSQLKVLDKDRAKKEKAAGTDHSKRDDFENAHKHYDNAIKFDPTDISLYSNKALVYMKQNMPEKVQEYSMKVILVAGKFGGDEKTIGKSYSRIAKTFLEKKEYKTALENFKKAMELNPCNATSENIKLCKKQIRQQELSEAVEDDDAPYPQLKHDFLLEERSRCLAEELKFYEALSLFEDLDSVDEGDIGMKLLTAECYIQLGREGKAEKAVRSVEKLLLRPPMCEIDDVISLANDFTGNACPIRALLLLRIAGYMLKESDREPNEIVGGLFRCIAKMNDPVSAMLKKPQEEEKTKMEEMQEMHQQMLEHYASTQKAIGMGDESVHFGIDPPRKPTPTIIKNRKNKTVVVDERSRVIAIDYGVEVMEEMLDDLRSVRGADGENIAIKQAILCNMINNNYSATGQHDKAIRLLKVGVKRLKEEFGISVNQHRIYVTMLVNIGAEYHNSERFYEAEKIEERALEEIDYVLDFNDEEEKQKEVRRIRESLRITRLHLKLA